MKLRNRVMGCTAATLRLIAGTPGAKEESLKEDAGKAGRAVGSAAREVWQGAKRPGKEVGHEAKKAGQAVGGAAKEGAQEFKRAFRGEKYLFAPSDTRQDAQVRADALALADLQCPPPRQPGDLGQMEHPPPRITD